MTNADETKESEMNIQELRRELDVVNAERAILDERARELEERIRLSLDVTGNG